MTALTGAAVMWCAAPLAATHAADAAAGGTRAGIWGQAIEVPGSGALNTGGLAQVNAVSCVPGYCLAGVSDQDSGIRAFVTSERNGHWGQAIVLPGSLNEDGQTEITSVSCASAGNCAVVGTYPYYSPDNGSGLQAFVTSERNGHWAR